jgi:hypothetical protein
MTMVRFIHLTLFLVAAAQVGATTMSGVKALSNINAAQGELRKFRPEEEYLFDHWRCVTMGEEGEKWGDTIEKSRALKSISRLS